MLTSHQNISGLVLAYILFSWLLVEGHCLFCLHELDSVVPNFGLFGAWVTRQPYSIGDMTVRQVRTRSAPPGSSQNPSKTGVFPDPGGGNRGDRKADLEKRAKTKAILHL